MSVRGALAWSFTGQLLVTALTFIGSVVVARLLSPHEMGVYALALAITGLISVLTTLGINAYVIREPALTEERLRGAWTVNALINAGLAALLFAGSWPLARFMGDAGVGQVLRWLAWVPLTAIVEFRPLTMLQREMRFRPTASVASVVALVNVGATVAFAIAGYSYLSMAYGTVLSTTLSAVLLSVAGREHIGFVPSLADWRPILLFGARMASISGVAVAAQRLSDIALGRLLGLAALGTYSRGANIANLLFANIYGTATRVAFVQLSAEYRETGGVARSFLRSTELITAILWPVVIGLAILAPPVVQGLYGPRWAGVAPVLAVLMVVQFVAYGFGLNWELFVIRERTAEQTRLEIARAIVGTVAFVVGCLFSIVAAAAGRLVEVAFGWLLYQPRMSRLAEVPVRLIDAAYGKSLLLTAAACAPSAALMLWYRWSAATPLPLVTGAVMLGGAAWLCALWRLGHPAYAELRRALLRIAPARG